MKRLITFLLPALLVLTACTIDEGGSHVKLREGETLTSFSVILPAEFSGPAGYAANITNDEVVKSFHVFAFDKDDNLAEHAIPEDFDPESPSLSFNVKFSDLAIGEKYTFMVLANIGGRYESLNLNGNPSRGDLRNALIMNESQVSTFGYIPMWGEQTVNSLQAEESITELNLLRMMARINVTTDLASGVFKLTSVHLFNRNTQGYLIPAGTSFGDVDPVAGSRATTYDSYSDQNGGVADGQLTNMIYTFESAVPPLVGGKEDFEHMHALVIGGEYEGGGDPTYYRVNFCKVGDDVTYLPLLRNYDYTINITKVNSAGYKKIEDAFDSNGLHMIEASVIDWNGDGTTEIAFDGQYWVSIPQKEWTLEAKAYNAAGGDNTITIKTNWTGDIDAAVTSGNSWLGVVEIKEDEIVNQEREFYITASANTNETVKEGTITLKVGRIKVTIEVNQLGKVEPTGIELYFDGESEPIVGSMIELTAGGDPVDITAKVLPVGVEETGVSWSIKDGNSFIQLQNGRITPVSAGTATITVTTMATPAISTELVVNVVSAYIPVESITLNRKENETIIINGNTLTITATVYPSNATDKTITWKATGEDVLVRLVRNKNIVTVTGVSEGTSEITATAGGVDSNPICKVKVVKFTGWAGSNIYWDGGKMTFDDEGVYGNQAYQGLYFKWGSLWGVSGVDNNVVYKPSGKSTSAWNDVLYNDVIIESNEDSRYLTDITSLDDEIYGDICRYLTLAAPGGKIHNKKWRMPTSNELKNAWSTGYAYTKSAPPTEAAEGDVEGKVKLDYGVKKGGYMLPAAGRRQDDGGMLHVGQRGYYWSARPNALGTPSWGLYFEKDAPQVTTYSRQFGYSVRCVVDDGE